MNATSITHPFALFRAHALDVESTAGYRRADHFWPDSMGMRKRIQCEHLYWCSAEAHWHGNGECHAIGHCAPRPLRPPASKRG
jgi:hypothetical protein